MIFTLRHRRPFDWPAMLQFFAARAIPGLETVTGDRYSRTGTFEVDGRLRVETDLPAALITPRLRRLFDLDTDLRAVNAHLSKDPTLAPLIAARPGLRVPGAWDPFELAVRAMLGQQISVIAARKLAGTLVARYGRFPRPEDLATDLSTLPMPRKRSAALTALAQAVLADPQLFEKGVTRLRELPGIGEWTAQYIAMRALRDPDAFPPGDIGLLRALGRPTSRELLTMAERWRPYRAYAAQHLWSAPL